MKKNLPPFTSLLAAFLMFFAAQAFGQTQGTGIILRVNIDGVPSDYYNGNCGYGTANWGGAFTNDICAGPQWGYDITPDSLGCDSIPAGQLAGKVALIRRGICGFSIKALNAQKGGAVVVLIANNATGATDCTVQSMGATQPQAGLTTIPCLFICRAVTNQIDNALKAGKQVEICFLRPDVDIISGFYPASSMQTPVTQIATDTFGFGVTVINTGTVPRTDIELKMRLTDQTNNVLYSLTETLPSLAPGGVDTFFTNYSGALFVPSLPIGKYSITYTSAADSVSNSPVDDRFTNDFFVTQNLFSKDDGPGVGFRPGTIGGDNWATGNVYTMSAASLEDYEVKTAEFAFTTNATELALADVEATIYLFRVNDAILPDWSNFEDAELLTPSMAWVGAAIYEAPSNVQAFAIQQVKITNLITGLEGVALDNGARYMLVAGYADSSKVTFSAFNQNVIAPGVSTTVFNQGWFLGGFTGGPNAVLRMYIDLVSTADEKPLPESVMNVFPNPVRETLNLGISFDKPTNATITIAEMSGRVIQMDDQQGLTNETLTYQLPQLASGVYLARIATAEGSRTKQFVIQK